MWAQTPLILFVRNVRYSYCHLIKNKIKFISTAINYGAKKMSVPACNNPNFLAMNDLSAQLMEQFCSCPEAKIAVDAFTKTAPIEVEVGDISRATTFRCYARSLLGELFLEKSLIIIPKQEKNSSRLNRLAYEIFNTQPNEQHDKLVALEEAGEIGMDLFAVKTELHEFNFIKNGYIPLIQKCQTQWKVESEAEDHIKYLNSIDVRDHLITQQIECHTDMYRIHWIKHDKDTYCKVHPEDSRSCQTQLEQLCDIDKMTAVDKEISTMRACILFSELSEEGKKLYEDIVKKYCEEKLQPSKIEL
jgi:hypothetical protein